MKPPNTKCQAYSSISERGIITIKGVACGRSAPWTAGNATRDLKKVTCKACLKARVRS